MNRFRSLSLLVCLTTTLSSLHATSVIPPSFDELVGRAEVIFQGSVTGIQSQWIGEGAQRHIVTYVTFKVEDAFKGAPGSSYTIRMLGGTVDGHTMQVTDAPKFKVGDHDILFVEHNGQQFIPLVGIMHGRFHLAREPQSGRDIVLTNSGEPVGDLARLGKEHDAAANAAAALSPGQFKEAVKAKLQSAAAAAHQP